MTDNKEAPNVFGKRAKSRAQVSGGVSAIRSAAHLMPQSTEPEKAGTDTEKPKPAKKKDSPKAKKAQQKKEVPKISDGLVKMLALRSEEAKDRVMVNTSLRLDEQLVMYVKAYAYRTNAKPAEVYREALKKFFEDPEVIAKLSEE